MVKVMGQLKLYGAELNIIPMDANHLPPNTLWVEDQDISQAYATLSDHIIHGEYTFGIWKMPKSPELTVAQDFFRASAGDMPAWDFKCTERAKLETNLRSPHNFYLPELLLDKYGVRAAQSARALTVQMAQVLMAHEDLSYLRHRLVSRTCFYADSGSDKIHVDGMKQARFFTSWAGPGPFLYDSSQLEPLP